MGRTSFSIIAHRGFSSQAPENTLAAFRLAIQSGFTNIELDVQLTRDNIPIVVHDKTVDRTTNGKGEVANLSYQDIQALDAGSWFSEKFKGEKVPSLEEVLLEIGPKAHLHIELKSVQHDLPSEVYECLQKLTTPLDHGIYEAPRITITSSQLEQLKRSIKLLPRVEHGWLISKIEGNTLDQASRVGITQICPNVSNVRKDAVNRAKQSGFSVRCWGLKKPSQIIKAYKAGTDGATTNWPDQAKQIIDNLAI
jgi:glycerophosphoryl diester phosphodiesterase